MTPARAVYITALGTVLALALVLQSAAIRESGYRLERLRAEITEARTEHALHLAHISKLKSPRRVLALVETLGLDLQERPVEHAVDPAIAAAAAEPAEPVKVLNTNPNAAPLADPPPGQPTTVASLAPRP